MRCIFALICAVLPIALACSSAGSARREPCTNDATAEAWEYSERAAIPDDETTCLLRRVLFTDDELPLWRRSDTTWHRGFGDRLDGENFSIGCFVAYPDVRAGLAMLYEPADASSSDAFEQAIVMLDAPEDGEFVFAALSRSCALEDGLRLVPVPGELPGTMAFDWSLDGSFDNPAEVLRTVVLHRGTLLVTFTASLTSPVDLAAAAARADARMASIGEVPEPDDYQRCDRRSREQVISEDLEGVFLSSEDLPARWVELVPDACVPTHVAFTGSCTELIPPAMPMAQSSKLFYLDRGTGVHLGQVVQVYRRGDAERVFEKSRALLERGVECEHTIVTSDWRETHTYRSEALPSGEFGADVVAYHHFILDPPAGLEAPDSYVVSMRRGDVVVRTRIAWPGLLLGADDDSQAWPFILEEFGPVLERAREKLDATVVTR